MAGSCIVFIFILMNTATKMNGHYGVIFIIIDHDNDDTARDGSDRLGRVTTRQMKT